MSSKKDWRLDGQEEYLRGVTLYHVAFTPFSEQWDHEHCVFCFNKFSTDEQDLHEGYCTEQTNTSSSVWICPNCFRDFHLSFAWHVMESKANP